MFFHENSVSFFPRRKRKNFIRFLIASKYDLVNYASIDPIYLLIEDKYFIKWILTYTNIPIILICGNTNYKSNCTLNEKYVKQSMMMLTNAFYYHGKTWSIMRQNSFWSLILTRLKLLLNPIEAYTLLYSFNLATIRKQCMYKARLVVAAITFYMLNSPKTMLAQNLGFGRTLAKLYVYWDSNATL